MVNVRRKKRNGDAPTTLSTVAAEYVEKINAAWQSSVESIIRTGRLLLEASERLERDFDRMFGEGGLRFSDRTAQRLMKIARHPIIGSATHVSRLPPSWGTLHALTRLPDDVLEELLADGTINPELERKTIEEICDLRFGDPNHSCFTKLREHLNALIDLSKKRMHLVTAAMILADADRGGSHTISAHQLQLLMSFVSDLAAALEGKEFDGARFTHANTKRVRIENNTTKAARQFQ